LSRLPRLATHGGTRASGGAGSERCGSNFTPAGWWRARERRPRSSAIQMRTLRSARGRWSRPAARAASATEAP